MVDGGVVEAEGLGDGDLKFGQEAVGADADAGVWGLWPGRACRIGVAGGDFCRAERDTLLVAVI